MKKILLSAVALLAVLVAILFARTLMLAAPVAPEAPASMRAVDGDAVAGRMAEVIRFRTISHQDPAAFDPAPFEDFAAWVESTYPSVSRALTREIVGEHSLLYTWEGSDPQLAPILLTGHHDVVPVIPGTEAKWTHPPFDGVVADGYIWGRGALDDKSAVIALLEAATLLVDEGFRPARTVYLAFGHDEELGGRNGAGAIVALEAEPMSGGIEGLSEEMFDALAPYLPFAQRIVLANRWLFGGILESMLSAVPTTNAMIRTTTAPTMLSGSIKENVLPIEAVGTVNFRLHPRDTVDDVVAHVTSVVDDERVEVRRRGVGGPASEVSSATSEGFATIGRAVRIVEPAAIVIPGLTIGGTDSRHYG